MLILTGVTICRSPCESAIWLP